MLSVVAPWCACVKLMTLAGSKLHSLWQQQQQQQQMVAANSQQQSTWFPGFAEVFFLLPLLCICAKMLKFSPYWSPLCAGLKLMTLAGYNPGKGPEAFTLLASELGPSIGWGTGLRGWRFPWGTPRGGGGGRAWAKGQGPQDRGAVAVPPCRAVSQQRHRNITSGRGFYMM